jgi:hypothetical protein
VLQPLKAPRWPAAPASPWWCEIRSGGRAAGPWPSPRARRQTGPSPGGQPGPVAWPSGEGDRGEEQAAVLQLLGHPAGQQPQPLSGGARSDPVGVLLDHGQVPGRDGRQRPSPGGRRARRPGSQERAAVLQLLGHPAGRQPQPLPGGARSDPVGVLLDHGQVPGRDGRQGHHLVDDPLRRPGPLGRVIVGRSELQCCNRSRHPAGQQPQPLLGGVRSDPVGVLLGHGQVHGRDGRQGHHLVGNRVRWPGPQERVIEGRSKLQCCNCWGTPLASSPSLSLVVRDLIRWACCWTMAKSPGGTADRGHHLVGWP